MRLPGIVLFILLSFFFHLSVNAADTDLLKIDRELRTLNTRIVRDFIAPAQKSNQAQKLVLQKAERKAMIELLGKYKLLFDQLESKNKSRRFVLGSSKKSMHDRVLAKIMLQTHGAKLFSEILSFPALLGIIAEHKKIGELPVDYVHSLIMKVARNTHKSLKRGRRMGFVNLAKPTMADFLSYPKEFSFWIKHSKLATEHKYLMDQLMDEYVNTVKSFSRKKRSLIKNRLFTKYLYSMKAKALTWLGDIALEDKNVLGKEYLDEMEGQLRPGDIGIINQDGRLSNLVFTGMWSHGLLYIGRYDQMEEMFEVDKETNKIYEDKCLDLKMKCTNYLSFMNERFPDSFKKYKESFGTEKEITVIEANSEGVGLSTTKYALAFNRVTAFRPKLAKKNIAMAIEEAFNNYGKPYDFNFDNRTYGRIVCTELIMYSYMPDPSVGKDGLDWFMSVIGGNPAMYGYDVVETYFEVPQSRRKLDFLFYYESPREGNFVKKMSVEDLRKTVKPDMKRFTE